MKTQILSITALVIFLLGSISANAQMPAPSATGFTNPGPGVFLPPANWTFPVLPAEVGRMGDKWMRRQASSQTFFLDVLGEIPAAYLTPPTPPATKPAACKGPACTTSTSLGPMGPGQNGPP